MEWLMDKITWWTSLEPHWFWLTIGIILGVAEILAPGFFLIWLAAAAIVTGVISALLPIGLAGQVLVFSILAFGSVYAGRRWFAHNPIESDNPSLNNRGAQLIGERVTVVEAIANGRGRVKVGDSEWPAKGNDAAAGSTVRVTGSDGATLLVEGV